MPSTPQLFFSSFRLDPMNACLWHGTRLVTMRPKTFRVLQYLLEHAGQLVTKEELLHAVWSETAVGDAVLKVCIGELRKLLQETIHDPQYITTIHRRGYRFIGRVKRSENGVVERNGSEPHLSVASPPQTTVVVLPPPMPAREVRGPAWLTSMPMPIVEREVVLQTLQERLARALQGERQTVFVTGEAGIGKTAVVEAFAAQAAPTHTLRIARGQCLESYGTGVAYLPILEAISQLCRQPDGDLLTALLRHQAPTWLVHMPWVLTEADRALLAADTQGATHERMVREITDVLDTLAAERLLLLIFEDLHWSDYATVDLIAALAQRRTAARLMIVGTYRPLEVLVREHPLWTIAQTLQRYEDCKDIPLALLSASAVAAYVETRFPGHQFPSHFVTWLYEHTDGQPLFVVTMIQALLQRGVINRQDGQWTLEVQDGEGALEVPLSLWQVLERQLTRLPEKAQRVIEVASVAGGEFAVALVAAELELSPQAVEAQCEVLVQQQWLQPTGMVTWPDSTTTARYSFTHTLYHQAAYKRLGEGRRVRLHQQLGQRLETAYGTHVGDIAAELAVHYERGQEVLRAMQYWQQAAETAASRHAYREVRSVLNRILRLLETLPAGPERDRHELSILTALGPALLTLPGQTATEVERVYRRALTLCDQVQDLHQRFLVLMGLRHFYETRDAYEQAKGLGTQLLALAQTWRDPRLLVEAHRVLGSTTFLLGEFATARGHLEQGLTTQTTLALQGMPYACDSEIVCRAYMALLLWIQGYPDQARQHSQGIVQLARERAHPHSLTWALLAMAGLYQVCGDAETTCTLAEEAMALAHTHGFTLWAGTGLILREWAIARQQHIPAGEGHVCQDLTAYARAGAPLGQARALSLLAETFLQRGQIQEGLKVISQALATSPATDVRYDVAELHRLKSALLMAHKSPHHSRGGNKPWLVAEESAQQALALARCQGAKSWELRSAITLCRVWQQQDKGEAARQLLEPLYGWFHEGFDTLDLQQARTVLTELS